MKTKSFVFIKITFLLMLSPCLISCGDDESEENGAIDNMTIEEQLLVGKWESDGNPLYLHSDMSCRTPDGVTGNYHYDPQTKELITTTGWGIRAVRSLDEKTMVLQSVTTKKSWTYKRKMGFIDNQYQKLLIGTWQGIDNDNSNKIIRFINSNTYDFGMGKFRYEIVASAGSIYVQPDEERDPDSAYLRITHLDCNTMIVLGGPYEVGASNAGTYKRVK